MLESARVRRAAAPALLLLAVAGLPACGGLMRSFGVGMPPELRRNGVPAPARILEIWDTGMTVNDDPVIGMKVEVHPADEPPFEATIPKTAISRLDVPRFQPGQVVPVRFSPGDHALVAVDFEQAAESVAAADAEEDAFVRPANVGTRLMPPPDVPDLFLGSADMAADALALYENGYVLVAATELKGEDARYALAQGQKTGAALVVVYGHVEPTPDVLPFRPRRRDAASSGAGTNAISTFGPGARVAACWAKTRPPILGIVSRPLDRGERSRLRRKDGLAVVGVEKGSPADAAGILAGDVLVAIDGGPLPDILEFPALVRSLAGKNVEIEVIRGGEPISMRVALAPDAP